MTEEKIDMLREIKLKNLHFAFDRYQDKDKILPMLKMFLEVTGLRGRDIGVYVLCGYDTTMDQDLERIYALRDLGYAPYVMLYNKDSIPKGHDLRRLQRWANNRFIFYSVERFEDYK